MALRKPIVALIIPLLIAAMYSFTVQDNKKEMVYKVNRQKKSISIDADWNKPEWRGIKEIAILNYMGDLPAFKPKVLAKMSYDQDNLYIIFRVDDKHVRIKTKEFNGPVSGDACVEFFFSPDSRLPERYFNLEINAAGTPLMGYHVDGRKSYTMLEREDIKQLEIAHSIPDTLTNEISEAISWTVECRVPLSLIRKFSNMDEPGSGVKWNANFYKTSSKSTNPHWITWSPVHNPVPDFHRPEFFSTLEFK